MDRVKEMRAMQEARDRAMAWKWVETLLVARQYMNMTIPEFYSTLPHYLDFIALHQSFQHLGVLSALVCKLWKDFCRTYRADLEFLLPRRRLQTNEVTRCANLLPAFHLVYERGGEKPLAMIEIGTSAGLNLNWHHYGYTYQHTLHVVLAILFSPLLPNLHSEQDRVSAPTFEWAPCFAQPLHHIGVTVIEAQPRRPNNRFTKSGSS